MFDLAYFTSEGGHAQVRDISERQKIPARFLEQIFQVLKREGFVGSKRGPTGGYWLIASPKDISLGQIIAAVEGPTELGSSGNLAQQSSPVEEALSHLAQEFDALAAQISLDDLSKRASALGLGKDKQDAITYSI